MKDKGTLLEIEDGYNVTVTGRHVHITDGMKQHAIDRISRLEKIGNRIIDVHVTMDIQKLDNHVEILMKYGHTVIRSHASTTDMYVSIDKAVDRLEQQLKRYKSRLQEHYAKGHPVHEIPESVLAISEQKLDEIDQEIESFEKKTLDSRPFHSVVAQETRPLKILTEDEAIMKMELSNDPFVIYRSESDRRIKVIYRRADGHYGVVQPE